MAKKFIKGGMEGLSAAINARLFGFDHYLLTRIRILEISVLGKYKIEDLNAKSILHMMIGTRPGSYYYNIWKPIGVFDSIKYYPFQISRSYVSLHGDTFNTDPHKLKV